MLERLAPTARSKLDLTDLPCRPPLDCHHSSLDASRPYSIPIHTPHPKPAVSLDPQNHFHPVPAAPSRSSSSGDHLHLALFISTRRQGPASPPSPIEAPRGNTQGIQLQKSVAYYITLHAIKLSSCLHSTLIPEPYSCYSTSIQLPSSSI